MLSTVDNRGRRAVGHIRPANGWTERFVGGRIRRTRIRVRAERSPLRWRLELTFYLNPQIFQLSLPTHENAQIR